MAFLPWFATLKSKISASVVVQSDSNNNSRYDFRVLDLVSKDILVIFLLATYGEGEPTDNALGLVDFLKKDVLELSQGGSTLPNLQYIMFCLGNTTYEHFCETGRLVDHYLQSSGANRIGPRGEGDDDKSLEEDYLAWKDVIWDELSSSIGLVEGAGSNIPDFKVIELETLEEHSTVYKGELSKQSLLGIRGIQDAKNPFISRILRTKELFQDGDRNCVSVEFDIKHSGIRYTTGDHVGVWPMNPDREVDRMIYLLGLESKRQQVIDIVSLDPALAKVPIPSPTTYDSALRYYLDISQLASRQTIQSLANYAPTARARKVLEQLGTNRDLYQTAVAMKGLRLSDVLLQAVGDDPSNLLNYTKWLIPLEHILSCIPRLQPRYYSISSSSRLHPDSIHATVVVSKTRPSPDGNMIYGLNSNFMLSINEATMGTTRSKEIDSPKYYLKGPREKHFKDGCYAVPIHTRLAKFRLPKSVKVPLIMIGPGTVSCMWYVGNAQH